ncbi:MAG: ParB/RepB/Spo0J family partition protein [Lachnospiraceae bacterium]|nr:ParB/RepB/Spo0J family partition protein [Lachnospiraceae bacterium]
MASKNKGLGRGLGTLLGEVADLNRAPVKPEAKPADGVLLVKTRLIEPNRNQPRKNFNDEELNELADSIRVQGVIQPLIVVKKGERYEIVAGERRWRAAKIVGLKEIPVLVREYDEAKIAEISLIENLQRKDLNPIEEAEAFRRLMDEYKMTQEELSERISKSRASIANALRLLKLPEPVRKAVSDGSLSAGHAKVLLALDNDSLEEKAALQVLENRLSVRETEKLVAALLKGPAKAKPKRPKLKNTVAYDDAAQALTEKFGTKVAIRRTKDNSGTIEIAFYSLEDFERIVSHIR